MVGWVWLMVACGVGRMGGAWAEETAEDWQPAEAISGLGSVMEKDAERLGRVAEKLLQLAQRGKAPQFAASDQPLIISAETRPRPTDKPAQLVAADSKTNPTAGATSPTVASLAAGFSLLILLL